VESKKKRAQKSVKQGDRVFDRGRNFIVKEVRVSSQDGSIAFLDTEGFWHGPYHPDEYLGVGEQEGGQP
jgi:hypothetical protein